MERRSARGSAGPAAGGTNKSVAESPGTTGKSPRSTAQQSTPAAAKSSASSTTTKKTVAMASPSKVAATPTTKAAAKQTPSSSIPTEEVPATTPEGGEVLLNRRGGSARQIKRNRFYYGGDNVNDDNWKQVQKEKMTPRKVKTEPVEVVEEEELGFDMNDMLQAEEVVKPTPVRPPLKKKSVKENERREFRGEKERQERNVMVPSPHKGRSPRVSMPLGDTFSESVHVPLDKIVEGAKKASLDKKTAQGTSLRFHYGGDNVKDGNWTKVQKEKMTPKKVKTEPVEMVEVEELGLNIPAMLRAEDVAKLTPVRPSLKKGGIAREKERREFRREKERDDAMVSSSSHKGRNRRVSSMSIGDSFSESMHVPLDAIVEGVKPTLDKKTAQEISLRLRNLLKLPKAHKWVCYEWFYSNIDKVLFDGENDFQTCFRESFPQLKARKLTRTEWTKIRRLMGKPRRCSQSFFDEEREELARRRQKIRMIQQRKVTDFNYKELPDEIPLQLVIGTKVTSRLRRPQDGLFTGAVEGVDTSNNTYRITFDRAGLGTHSIPDYEVLSNEAPETVSTSSFALKIPRRSYGAFSGGQFKFQSSGHGDEAGGFPKPRFPVDGMLGGFPIRLLDMIVRLSKLLKAKREKILQLKELNVEAEKMRSYGKLFNTDFRTRYARCVLDLSSMNKEMALYLDGVQQYCLEIAPDHGAHQMIIPEHVQEQCDHESSLIVSSCNNKPNRGPAVVGTKALSLITKLTSMLLQAKALSPGERNLYEVKSIRDSLKEIKAGLEGQNVQLFQDRIEIPMNRIQAGLTLSAASKYQNNLH